MSAPKRKPKKGEEGSALRRLRDVNRLAELRAGRYGNPAALVFVYADAMRTRGRPLDVTSSMVAAFARRHALDISRGEVSDIVATAMRRAKMLSPPAAGEVAELIKAERRPLEIYSMEAVDETLWERQDYVAENRRAADCKRKRKDRAGKCKPQAESISRKEPWKAFGWSRAKWYREGKPQPPAEAPAIPIPAADEKVA